MFTRRRRWRRRLLLIGVLSTVAAGTRSAPTVRAQMATVDRLESPGWWPTKGTASRADFVGPEACARCHVSHAETQKATSMAGTVTTAARSEVLRTHRHLSVRLGAYSYDIATNDKGSMYSVSDGMRTISTALAWAFGIGRVGQTFLFEREGRFQEGHVSYYDAPKALGVTPGRHWRSPPRSLEEAAGRPMSDAEAGRCFGCHNTASATEGRFDAARLIAGVTCEACHGPGRQHVAAAEQRHLDEARERILNPGKLDPVDAVDFCGACHATWWDVKLAHETGVAALRSQPHRLQNSACWAAGGGGGDARLTCTACHDPHEPLVREAPSYDSHCLGCHTTAGAPADARAGTGPTTRRDKPIRPCKIGGTGCTGCHMPKYEVAEMHFKFTDHQIRVVRSGPFNK